MQAVYGSCNLRDKSQNSWSILKRYKKPHLEEANFMGSLWLPLILFETWKEQKKGQERNKSNAYNLRLFEPLTPYIYHPGPNFDGIFPVICSGILVYEDYKGINGYKWANVLDFKRP